MILAIGNSGSYEVAAYSSVIDELERRGKQAVLFKQDKCLEDEHMFFESSRNQSRFAVIIDGVEYDLGCFEAVWYLKPHLPKELMLFEPVEYRTFIERQFRAMRTATWSILKSKRWIDDPWKVEAVENKLYQLHVASSIGLTHPETLITSSPNRAREFFFAHAGDVVVKLLAPSLMMNKVVYTNKVTEENLERIESLRLAPSIFQARVAKAFELRITIVGDQIFAVKIDSQQDAETQLDWRRKPLLNDYEVKMEPVVLPEQIMDQLRDLMRVLGLRFGCIDMIVTPDGQYIFLEINPNGQWYFVQLNTELQIASAIADLLSTECRN